MATKYIVDNLSGQTINGQQLQPYKVYTALLTQSGGDNIQSISSGALTKGVTYNFGFLSEGEWDFSNVGGPVFPNNYPFVATSDSVPNSWDGQELQYNTGTPVVTVLENTLGDIWFTYNNVGDYNVYSNSLFTNAKSIIFISNSTNDTANPEEYVKARLYDQDFMFIFTFASNQPISTFTSSNDILFNTPIEIRVYN